MTVDYLAKDLAAVMGEISEFAMVAWKGEKSAALKVYC